MTAELPYHQIQQNNIGVKPPTPLHTVPHRTAFAPAAPAARSATALSAEQSRADFLRAGFAAAATTSAAALVLSPSEASAAKYGPLGRGSPEVVDPKTADVDLDVLSSATGTMVRLPRSVSLPGTGNCFGDICLFVSTDARRVLRTRKMCLTRSL